MYCKIITFIVLSICKSHHLKEDSSTLNNKTSNEGMSSEEANSGLSSEMESGNEDSTPSKKMLSKMVESEGLRHKNSENYERNQNKKTKNRQKLLNDDEIEDSSQYKQPLSGEQAEFSETDLLKESNNFKYKKPKIQKPSKNSFLNAENSTDQNYQSEEENKKSKKILNKNQNLHSSYLKDFSSEENQEEKTKKKQKKESKEESYDGFSSSQHFSEDQNYKKQYKTKNNKDFESGHSSDFFNSSDHKSKLREKNNNKKPPNDKNLKSSLNENKNTDDMVDKFKKFLEESKKNKASAG